MKKHKAIIVFGTDDARLFAKGKFKQMDVPPKRMAFETKAELIAYLKGVDDGNGWLEYFHMNAAGYAAYKRAGGKVAVDADYVREYCPTGEGESIEKSFSGRDADWLDAEKRAIKGN